MAVPFSCLRAIKNTHLSMGVFAEMEGFVCIFTVGENIGFAPSSRREQQSTGLLHLDHSNPYSISM